MKNITISILAFCVLFAGIAESQEVWVSAPSDVVINETFTVSVDIEGKEIIGASFDLVTIQRS